ncbi:MAG: AAA family ATPase, partial [Halobacteriota archaeon]
FGEERTAFFTGREGILAEIDAYVDKNENHEILAIHGAPGSGKTALMAEAAQRAAERYPEAVVVARFVGATAASTKVRSLLEFVCKEIAHRFGEDESSVPDEYEALVKDFQQRVERISQRTSPPTQRRMQGLFKRDTTGQGGDQPSLIIFLDALDQLSDDYDARHLTWLPAQLPDGVRLIVSTLPGESLTALEERPSSRLVELTPLSADEGKVLLDRWLADAHRTLQPNQRDEVLTKFAGCSSPLYLKLAFEEARRWHSFASPVPLSTTITGILGDLFARLARDHGDVLVSHGLGYLGAARYGLTEDELLDVLSRDRTVCKDFIAHAHHTPPERRLPVVVWSRLFFDLEPYLTERSADGTSLITFYHRQFGEVVAERFLSEPNGRQFRLALAAYFDDQPLFLGEDAVPPTATNRRKVSELPFQLSQALEWKRLYDVLKNLSFLHAAWLANKYEVRAYWNAIEENTELSVVEAYWHVADDPTSALTPLPFRVLTVGGRVSVGSQAAFGLIWTLWHETGHEDEVQYLGERLSKRLIEHFRSSGDDASLSHWLGHQAHFLIRKNDFDGALALLKEQELVYRKSGQKDPLANSLANQADILIRKNDLDGALALFKEEERIVKEIKNTYHLHHTLGHQAGILTRKNDLDGALALYKEQEDIIRDLKVWYELPDCLGIQAYTLSMKGDLIGALALYKEAERICRGIGDKDRLLKFLGNRADILSKSGDLDGAMELYKEQDRICREIGDKAGLQRSLRN